MSLNQSLLWLGPLVSINWQQHVSCAAFNMDLKGVSGLWQQSSIVVCLTSYVCQCICLFCVCVMTNVDLHMAASYTKRIKTERRRDSPQSINILWQKPQWNPGSSVCTFSCAVLSKSDQNTAALVDFSCYCNPRASLSCIRELKCQLRIHTSRKNLTQTNTPWQRECRHNKEIFHIVTEDEQHSSEFSVKAAIRGYITNLDWVALQQSLLNVSEIMVMSLVNSCMKVF